MSAPDPSGGAPHRTDHGLRGAATGAAVAVSIRLALGAPRVDDGAADWPTVLAVASRELLASLAWTRSRRFIQTHADQLTAATWRRAAVAAHLRGQGQLRTLRQAITALDARGVHAVVLKGLPLGDRLYGDAFARCSSDIDLYVPASQRRAAATALAVLGWTREDGAAPWHEAWWRADGDAREYLELHSSLVNDHLAHLPVPPALGVYREVAGECVPAFEGTFLPAYLAVHLATHQMPPLLWVVDFATVWWGLSPEEQSAAMRAAESARVGRYLRWAAKRADAVRRAADGDDASLHSLGVTNDGRRDVHSILRHLMLAHSPADRARVLGAFVVPRKTRGNVTEVLRYSLARLRTRLASLAGARRSYTAGGSAPDESANAQPGQHGRPLRVERGEMVPLVRDVVYAGGAIRVRAPGGSMLPTIPRGALVRIQGVPERGIVRGDVVLALTADGEPVLHRVIGVDGETLILRGDAALSADPPTPLSRVIGIATHVSHLGVEREVPERAPRSLSVAAMQLRRRFARAVGRGR